VGTIKVRDERVVARGWRWGWLAIMHASRFVQCPPPAAACCCLLLPAAAGCCLLLPAAAGCCLLLHAAACCCLLLPATIGCAWCIRLPLPIAVFVSDSAHDAAQQQREQMPTHATLLIGGEGRAATCHGKYHPTTGHEIVRQYHVSRRTCGGGWGHYGLCDGACHDAALLEIRGASFPWY
jgi:hypothetical protein